MPSERSVTRILFAAGAGLVVATFTYSILHSWPAFDPIASATLIGIGLLLVVIYERLGAIHRTLERILATAQQPAPPPGEAASSRSLDGAAER